MLGERERMKLIKYKFGQRISIKSEIELLICAIYGSVVCGWLNYFRGLTVRADNFHPIGL